MGAALPGTPLSERPPEDRLDSWKEIAAYLNRDVTTVQRWEKREAMPVHRHLHDRIGTVYASRAELDVWVRGRNLQAQENESSDPSPDPPTQPPHSEISASRTIRSKYVLLAAMEAVALVVGTSLWVRSTEYFWRNPIADAKFQTITDFDEEEQAAAVSRDGHFVAFLSDRDGQMDVWVTQIRNVTAIVLEVPSLLIGRGRVHAWATISLYGHAPEMRVSRWGLPLITHLFLNDPNAQDVKEQFNTSIPSGDMAFFSEPIAEFIETMTRYAISAVEPADYAKKVTSRLCPVLLPYELETTARFSREAFNGRPLGDDAMDVMLTLACNKPLSDGVAPDKSRIRNEFPYYGEPYTKEEQAQVTRIAHASKK